MSFILDALKKSEQERERQQAPTLIEIPYGRRSRAQPLWMTAVMGLLLLNCILLLVMWWRSSAEPATPVTTPSAGAAATVNNTAAATNSSAAANNVATNAAPLTIAPPRSAEVRPLQDEASSESEGSDETATALTNAEPDAGQPLVRTITPLEQAMAQQQAAATQFKASSPGNTMMDNTPTLDSLGGSGALNLPELRLDVHVYSSVAAERFAFINTRKYSEGQELREGPHLDKITADGVILSYRNQRFLLPRR